MDMNKRYTLKAEAGTISDEGIRQITALIGRQRLSDGEWQLANPDNKSYGLFHLPEDWEFVWQTSRGEFRGNFPKRVAQYYYKTHNLKCPWTFLTELGNLARNHSADDVTYTFEFVSEIDWQSGEFGDYGSCYWGDRAGAREMLENNGGFAVRFYNGTGRGIARAWMVEVEENLRIVFNGHGFAGDATLIIARVVAQFFSASYTRIRLTNDGDASGVLWIDGGKAYFIGDAAVIAGRATYELSWEEIYAYEYSCYECGDGLGEYDVCWGVDDMAYCEDCYSELFDSCQRCGETRYASEIRLVKDRYICVYCIEQTEPPARKGKGK